MPSHNASIEHCVTGVVDRICFACSAQARSFNNDLADDFGSTLFFLEKRKIEGFVEARE